jgi:osmotically inducible protein OsmC
MPASSTARAHWEGALLTGSGTVSTASPALDAAPMTWKARIGEHAGTTPEELLAAAHASCFCMAFSGALAKAGHEPSQLDAEATFTFGPVEGGFAIQGVTLRVEGIVPGIEESEYLELAEGAKTGCPVSKALSDSLPVTLEAKLLQHA